MSSEKKKIIVFILLVSFILFSVFLIYYGLNIFLNGKNQDQNNNITVIENEGNTIFKEPEETHEHGEDGHNHPEEETIFEEDTITLTPFIINEPTTLKNVKLPSTISNIFYANSGFVFVFSENQEIQFYDPTREDYFALDNTIIDVTYSNNGKDLLFQKIENNEYVLYKFDYINNNKGFEVVSSGDYPYHQYGLLDNTLYFTRGESDNAVYFFPIDEANSQEPFPFITTYYDYINTNNNFILGYNKKQNLLEARNKQGEILFKSATPKGYPEIVDLKIKKNSKESLNYVAIFSEDEKLLRKKFVYNGKEVEELRDTYNMSWIDDTYIVAMETGFSDFLFIYNLKTGDRYNIDYSVNSMFYDENERTIYYTKFEHHDIFKISLD